MPCDPTILPLFTQSALSNRQPPSQRPPESKQSLCEDSRVGPSGKRLVGVLHSFFLQGGDRTGHKVTMCRQGHIKRASVDTLPID